MDAVGLIVTIVIGVAGLIIGILQIRQARRRPDPAETASPPPRPADQATHSGGQFLQPCTGYEHATATALNIVGSTNEESDLTVRYVETPGELYALWRIDDEAYGRASITYDTFEQWWRKYPSGLKALFFGAEIVGAIGIWPVSKQWASSFSSGTSREMELPTSALGYYRSRASTCWYISGIVLTWRLRTTKAIRTLLEEALRLWISRERSGFPIELLALAYSPQGEALLRRFSFSLLQASRHTPDGFPLYRRKYGTRDELIEAFAQRGLAVEPSKE